MNLLLYLDLNVLWNEEKKLRNKNNILGEFSIPGFFFHLTVIKNTFFFGLGSTKLFNSSKLSAIATSAADETNINLCIETSLPSHCGVYMNQQPK